MDWDPGGRRLIASRDGIELFVLYRTGAPASRFISAPLSGASKTAVSGREPAWSPNGRRIAFVRRRLVPSMSAGSEQQEIWTCDADGTNARRIWKRYDGFDSDRSAPSLSWQPLPR
jgi:Tol biopolymer transport system component